MKLLGLSSYFNIMSHRIAISSLNVLKLWSIWKNKINKEWIICSLLTDCSPSLLFSSGSRVGPIEIIIVSPSCLLSRRLEASSIYVVTPTPRSDLWTRGELWFILIRWRLNVWMSSISATKYSTMYLFDQISNLFGKIVAQRFISSTFDVR